MICMCVWVNMANFFLFGILSIEMCTRIIIILTCHADWCDVVDDDDLGHTSTKKKRRKNLLFTHTRIIILFIAIIMYFLLCFFQVEKLLPFDFCKFFFNILN